MTKISSLTCGGGFRIPPAGAGRIAGTCFSQLVGSRNHLSGESAPYLERAVAQSVDWYPWGAEAFKGARELNRPILLDVGVV